MSRVGIMGGTFDPIHLAHLRMARCALEQKNLGRVLFMPSKLPPHKQDKKVTDEAVRCEMVKLALEGEAGFAFSDFECRREETSYTARTLELLHKAHPEDDFFFILGGDSLAYFGQWYMPGEILRYATVLAVGRGDTPVPVLQKQAEGLMESFGGRIELLTMERLAISSSMIRERIAQGKPVREFLPERVYEYIMRHGCYF